mgnify:CR=1 FL=1
MSGKSNSPDNGAAIAENLQYFLNRQAHHSNSHPDCFAQTEGSVARTQGRMVEVRRLKQPRHAAALGICMVLIAIAEMAMPTMPRDQDFEQEAAERV